MISTEIAWMIFLGALALIMFVVFFVIVHKNKQISDQCDQLEEELQQYRQLPNESRPFKVQTTDLIRLHSSTTTRIYPDDGLSAQVNRMINTAVLELAGQLVSEDCVDVEVSPNPLTDELDLHVSIEVIRPTEHVQPNKQMIAQLKESGYIK